MPGDAQRALAVEPVIDVLLVVGGVVLLMVTAVDLLWTTVWPEAGAGPVTARVTGGMWTLVRRHATDGRWARAIRSLAGPVTLVTVVVLWVALMYAGWALIYTATDAGIVRGSTQTPADVSDRLYFTGYSLFTLGNGDLHPASWPWQLATVLTTANGLLLITLAVTYLIPVVSAATAKRALAGQITSLGTNAGAFAASAWGRQGFAAMAPFMASLTSTLGTLGDQHLAYPVLHYFHSRPVQRSSAVAVAVLDEALTIMRFAVAEHARPEPAVLAPARETVGSYLDTLSSGFVPEGDTVPPPPDLRPLRRAGIPLVAEEEFAAALQQVAQRRRMLLGLVEAEGGSWELVTAKTPGVEGRS